MWLAVVLLVAAQQPDLGLLDILIRGASLVDVSGTPARRADVGIRGDTIVAVGALEAARAKHTIE